MAKKNNTVFVCQECGYESPKWTGRCICGAWNSFVEEKVVADTPAKGIGKAASSGFGGEFGKERGGEFGGASGVAIPLRNVDIVQGRRLGTGISELDRVLGSGITSGSLTLIAGEPGIGKSTLILQAAASIAAKSGTVLYVSGEESSEQVRLRADRIAKGATDAARSTNSTDTESVVIPDTCLCPVGYAPEDMSRNPNTTNPKDETNGAQNPIPENLYILSETNIENIFAAIQNIKPVFLIIDSIQTMHSEYIESAAGSVSQIRACTNELMRFAKASGVPIFIVAHVTKSGELAGPKVIEHIVDCVLSFTGDRTQDIRILRAQKNRFGTTSEIGAFEMVEEGLSEITNLSGSLLEDMDTDSEGQIATAVYEGTRPLLLEMQALTAAGGPGFPRRTALGVELARLNMIIAVLERKAGLDLSSKDVYVNVVGGIRPEGTSVDLAVALSIYSSAKGVTVPRSTCAIGEIGLAGELRSVRGADRMVIEAARLGFARVIMPKKNAAKLDEACGIEIISCATVAEAVGALALKA